MPVIRMVYTKVKPGRMQDAVTQLSTTKRIVLESGATDFTAYNIITGPYFPALNYNAVCEDLAAFGAAREKVLQHPDFAPIRNERDTPMDILNALLVEDVYVAGDVAGNIGQTNVRFTISYRPHRGRRDDVVRRLSRLADTVHQCGALAVAVRNVIAGMEGPRMGITSYHAGFSDLQTTREAVRESDVWNALSRNQDEAATRMLSFITTKLDV